MLRRPSSVPPRWSLQTPTRGGRPSAPILSAAHPARSGSARPGQGAVLGAQRHPVEKALDRTERAREARNRPQPRGTALKPTVQGLPGSAVCYHLGPVGAEAEPDTGTLQRIVPDDLEPGDDTGLETLQLHLERYEFAARHVRPGRLLDIACGVGYGARLLADRCADEVSVLGVDVSDRAIAYARRRYGGDGLAFRVADAYALDDREGFHSIVTLETIEHLPDPRGFISRLRKMLRPDGVLVASVPTTPSTDLNPHHLHNFTEASFRRLFSDLDLTEIDCHRQVQKVDLRALMQRRGRLRDVRRNLPVFYLRHPPALARRVASSLRHGITNRYTTIAWKAGP